MLEFVETKLGMQWRESRASSPSALRMSGVDDFGGCYSLLGASQDPRLTNIRHVDKDVISRMTVQGCAQTLLIKVVANETNTATENEKTI